MKRRMRLLFLATTISALMPIGNPSQARAGDPGRGCAIQSPLDSPDCPGKNAAGDDALGVTGAFFPYWNPLVPISNRWNYTDVIPYYSGICRWGIFHKDRCCQHSEGPDVAPAPAVAGVGYGIFTGSPQNEAVLLHLGGAGQGLPRATSMMAPPPASKTPDDSKPTRARESDEPKKETGKTKEKARDL